MQRKELTERIGRGKEQSMKEIIVRMTADRIKVKGGEYVRDLVRCGECKWDKAQMIPKSVKCIYQHNADDFCSYGERSIE